MFTITGYHYHNSKTEFGAQFLAETVLKNLRQEEVPLPPEERERWPEGPKTFPLKKLGLGFPVLITANRVEWKNTIQVEDPSAGESDEAPGTDAANEADDQTDDKDESKPAKGGARGAKGSRTSAEDGAATKPISAPRYDFTIQFCWQVPSPDVFVEITHLYPGDQAMQAAAALGNEVAKAAAVGDQRAATGEAGTNGDEETAPADGAAKANGAANDTAEPGGANEAGEAGKADGSVPGDRVPGDRVPGDRVPGDRVPADRVPADGISNDGGAKAADAAKGDQSEE